MDTFLVSKELKEALFETASFIEKEGLFTQEVHLFMHCHLKGYVWLKIQELISRL